MSTVRTDHPVGRHLDIHYRNCLRPSRHRRIASRWAQEEPALAGQSIEDIVAVCRTPTVDQNPIVAALLRLHQSADDDATTVLMVILSPAVRTIARRTYAIYPDEVAAAWTGAAHAINTTDPEFTPTRTDGTVQPFMSYLTTRIRCGARLLNPAERRSDRNYWRGISTPNLQLIDDTVDWSDTDIDVEAAALARVELSSIRAAIDTSTITESSWRQLVRHRIERDAIRSDGATRIAVWRTSRQLAQLVGRGVEPNKAHA